MLSMNLCVTSYSLGKYLCDRSCQSSFTMVNVTDGTDITMRFCSFKFSFCHFEYPPYNSACKGIFIKFYVFARLRLIIFQILQFFKPFSYLITHFSQIILFPVQISVPVRISQRTLSSSASLCPGTKICGVSKHLRQRHISANDLAAAQVIHTLDPSTTGVDIADDVAHVFFRHGDFHLHDRLKKYWRRFLHSVFERQRTCDVERHLTGVYLVEDPSYTLAWIPTTGNPPRIPDCIASSIPSPTAGMYSFGIAPPTTVDSNL